MIRRRLLIATALLSALLPACSLSIPAASAPQLFPLALPTQASSDPVGATALPVRPNYSAGELVDYIAQSGDTLPALAARFNTTMAEIRAANPVIPNDATTMPQGFPMKIPIYFKALWATPYKMLPDSAFVNGPRDVGFNTSAFVASKPGWLRNYRAYAGYQYRSGAEIVDYVATNYSVSPRLLLAILEYKAGALSQPEPPDKTYILDFPQPIYEHAPYIVYTQLFWAANTLNNGYYGWRSGKLTEFDLPDGTIFRPDPWQNAASIALMNFFNTLLPKEAYLQATSPEGFARTYATLFGDPWAADQPHIPGSLEQPTFSLPFRPGEVWAFTGGPHTAWGFGEPLAALDFAPPAVAGGCLSTDLWATAVADGVVARSGMGEVVLDLDGDGDERTGWAVFYLHLATVGRAPIGAHLKAGDPVGHPSCEGGESTGTHVHIARKYNGEWIPAEGMLAFNLEGWVAHNGSYAYLGSLTRLTHTVTACVCSNQGTFIMSEKR